MQHLDDLADDELADLYAYPPSSGLGGPGGLGGAGDPEGAVVRANFVATLDGSATGDDGRSGSINDPADHRVFDLLRALSDVVLVGAGTARDEGYGRVRTPDRWVALRTALGLADHPALAVVTRSLDVPEALLEPADGAGELLVVSTQDADPARLGQLRERLGDERLLLAGRGSVDLAHVVERLAGSGRRRVLAEGGPQLMNDLVRAGVLDELCLTVAPLLVGGDGPRIGRGAPVHERMRLAHALVSDGPLLTRWTRA
ncbi:pyrimidine reductase family protein [Angustibacter peucedani]